VSIVALLLAADRQPGRQTRRQRGVDTLEGGERERGIRRVKAD
jgi:hypothetical protein